MAGDIQLTSLSCCGISELDGLSAYATDSEQAFMDLCDDTDAYESDGRASAFGCGALIFTQAGKNQKYGTNFAKFIEKHGLGEVTQVPTFRNPNTGNPIATFVWKVNSKAVQALQKKLAKTDKYAIDNEPAYVGRRDYW